ncbi:glycoside hydrolase family 28 protein [Commensalibacter intestini]|nr:glycosyl hydrolase family 28 protein [Commensalibacter intestini]
MSKFYLIIGLCVLMPFAAWAKGNPSVCKPEIYGGRADGNTINTDAIQKAVDMCAQYGGGVVLLSKGVWLSGPITLKSNITFSLGQGTVLKANNTDDQFKNAFIDYPVQKGEAFILADHVHDVSIVGQGTIDGDGQQTWWAKAKQINALLHQGNDQLFKQEYSGVPIANGVPRPWLIEFNDVQNVHLKGVLLTNAPMWNVVIRSSQDVNIDTIKIQNPKDSPNTDGIDIVSSQYIQISDVDISTGDDNISIKSGLQQGNALPARDITIKNSLMHDGHGISIGSETANGIGKVTIQNIHFSGSTNGIRIKSQRDRGNSIGPITVDHIQMENVTNPIVINASYSVNSYKKRSFKEALKQKELTSLTPLIHDILLSDIHVVNADNSIILSGLPEAFIWNIVLDHIFMQAKHGLKARYVQGVMHQVIIQNQEGDTPFYFGNDTYLKRE